MTDFAQMLVLAQDDGGGGLGALLIGTVIPLLIALLVVAGVWKTFAKAGKPGWACIIPIYNVIVMLEIAGKPIWWLILFFIPFVNIIVAILVPIEIAKAFGKGAGFGLGLAFLGFIFYPILGFGDATYTAPAPAT